MNKSLRRCLLFALLIVISVLLQTLSSSRLLKGSIEEVQLRVSSVSKLSAHSSRTTYLNDDDDDDDDYDLAPMFVEVERRVPPRAKAVIRKPVPLTNATRKRIEAMRNKTRIPQQKDVFWELLFKNVTMKAECSLSSTSRPLYGDDVLTKPRSPRMKWKQIRRHDEVAFPHQFLIHVHGLHHTGTGYLRNSLYDVLGGAHHVSLHSDTFAKEDEGQHVQSVFPSYNERLLERRKHPGRKDKSNLGQLSYLAEFCHIDAARERNISNRDLGTMLMDQWAQYWDMSKPVLIQKSPTVDVEFLERVKVLPTFHVMIVRHPMASNSWVGLPSVAYLWLDIWTHTFQLLRQEYLYWDDDDGDGRWKKQPRVEWYAVVTYESLVQYHDAVMFELLDIFVRGQQHFGSAVMKPGPMGNNFGKGRMAGFKRNTTKSAFLVEKLEQDTHNSKKHYSQSLRRKQQQKQKQQRRRRRRRLEFHNKPPPYLRTSGSRLDKQNNKHNPTNNETTKNFDPLSYLIPKEKSIKAWKACYLDKKCKKLLDSLTMQIFPYFGYNCTSSYPGPVSVTHEYRHVLFSSIGGNDDDTGFNSGGYHRPPSMEMLTKMKYILKTHVW